MNAASMPERCTQAEYVRYRGVDRSLISRWAKEHKIVLDAERKVVVASSDALLSTVLHPTKGGGRVKRVDRRPPAAPGQSTALQAPHAEPGTPAPSPAAPPPAGAGQGVQTGASALSVAEATRAEKFERTRLLRLEVAKEAGALVRRDVVETETFKRARQAQELLMALKDRLVPLLANESDEHAIDTLLDTELRQVIAVIAGPNAASLLEDAA